MPSVDRYAAVVKPLAFVLSVLGLWILVAPYVLAGAADVFEHVGVGASTLLVSLYYFVRIHRDPDAKIPSIWFVLVLGALLFLGAVLTQARGTIFFWSTLVSSALLVALAAATIYWGSRFGTGHGIETTIFKDQ